MARVYSTCLYRGQSANEFVTIDFAPVTDTVVIRDVVLFTLGGGSAEISLADEANTYLIVATLGPPLDYLHWEGRQVLDPGSSLLLYVNGSMSSVRISGYLLGA